MNEYRRDVSSGLREAQWTFFKGIPLFVMVVVFLSLLGFGLNSIGLFGKTVVERKVFENSFQYSEALKAQIATDEAVIAEIKTQLSNPELDNNTRVNLTAQLNAAKVRIAIAKGRQK